LQTDLGRCSLCRVAAEQASTVQHNFIGGLANVIQRLATMN